MAKAVAAVRLEGQYPSSWSSWQLGGHPALQAFAHETVVTKDRPHSPVELAAFAATCEPSSFSPAVPLASYKQRSRAVSSRQSRSLGEDR
jgi:hypothetical protein